MKKFSAFLIVALFASMGTTMEAQVLKKFMERRADTAKAEVGKRLEFEADKTVKEGVNKGLDRIFGGADEESESGSAASGNSSSNSGSSSSSSNQGSSSSSSDAAGSIGMNALMGAMGMSGNVEVKDTYNFDGILKMAITTIDGSTSEKEKALYTTYLDRNSYDYGVKFYGEDDDGVSTIIFDSENSVMLTLVVESGQKSGFALKFDPETFDTGDAEGDAEEVEEIEDNPYAPYKTGKTKKINGYLCEEYVIDSDEAVTTMWITKDKQSDFSKDFLRSSTFTGMFTYAYYTAGMVMEYVVEDKSDKDVMRMEVTEIDLKQKTKISTSGYNIMSMGDVPTE